MATGSKQRNLTLKTTHLPHLISHFPAHRITTGDSPLVPKGRGKPHPDIFEIAARTLGLDIDGSDAAEIRKGTASLLSCRDARELINEFTGCLVFEDGVPGVTGAKAAGMQVVWVPDPELRAVCSDEEVGATQTLGSLEHFDPQQWGLPAYS
jgi:pseudouridine-5'-monophosphatase